MSSISLGIMAFVLIFSGALLGIRLRTLLPAHHLSKESYEMVKAGAGLMATLAALILGLLVSSAKSNLDAMNAELTQTGAKIILLDRTLANYGPEAAEMRGILRGTVARVIEQIWPEDSSKKADLASAERSNNVEMLQQLLHRLTPRDDNQRQLHSQASQIISDLAQTHWVLIEQTQQPLPGIFIGMLLFWLTSLFVGFGLLSPGNGTVIVILLICALSMAGAIFLINEMSTPVTGVIKVSSRPFLKAYANLGR